MDYNATVTIAVVGVLATCVGGLLWIIKFMFNKLLPMMEKVSKATDANTKATKNADKYLKDRNGRDHEAHAETLLAIKEVPETMKAIAADQQAVILKAVQIKDHMAQHIDKQEVTTQVIKEKK